MPFGIKIYTGEMVVSGFTNVDGIKESYSPAYNAGIREKDIILKINNKTINRPKLTLQTVYCFG